MRIVDLSRLVAGNVVTHVLADLGAEVIKVEDPVRGDDLRNWHTESIATYWKVYARNKRSLALDYRKPEGLAVLRELLRTAHAMVENFVPGKLERLGLDPAGLRVENPKLVVLRISGWGQTGPFRNKPGFGSLVEAASGFSAMNGFPDRPPVLPPLALADMVTGLYGSTALLTAARHAERAGEGQDIDLSLFEPMLSILGPQAANYAITGTCPPRVGSRSSTTAPRNVYVCKDGKYVALSASMQAMAERLFHTMGRADLLEDERFRTNTARVQNIDLVDGVVADFMRQHTQAELLEIFTKANVTVGPVFDAADLTADPYVEERESLVALPDDEMGLLPTHNIVPRLSKTPGVIRTPAPALGADTAALLEELGIDDQTVAALRRAEAIRQAD
jgi:crotonobetainyl-CoA:carnitine CoA-transferase CaiB-like acyl-CoA transferase